MLQRSNRSITCLQYFVSSVHMRNNGRQKNQSKYQNKTNRSKKKTLNNHLTSYSLAFFKLISNILDLIPFMGAAFNPHLRVREAVSQWYTAPKMKFSIKDFFSKCDQIRRKLRVCSHLLKKSLTS